VSELLAIVGALTGVYGTYLAYMAYQQQTSLRRVIVEVDAYLESDARASLLIVLRNTGDEAVRVSRLRAVKPSGAYFLKERRDGYRADFLGIDQPLAPKGGDAKANLFQKAINVVLMLPAKRVGAGQVIKLRARCEFASSIDKSGWLKTKTILMPTSGK
jgi:hypothetical protein